MGQSLAEKVALLPADEQEAFFDEFPPELLVDDWEFWARPEQLRPEGNWSNWLCRCGRGWGKTHVGAKTVEEWARETPGIRIALVAPTAADARDVMIEGDSGILSVARSDFMPRFNPSKRKVTWPNGSVAIYYSAEKPARLRGPQHHKAWCDELCAWEREEETWDMLQMGLRLGDNPQAVITTTPKPTETLLAIQDDSATHLTIGSTYDNQSNLAPKFLDTIKKKYEGTRLGEQELHAKVLNDKPGALWKRHMISDNRVKGHPDLVRIVVAIDPAVTSDPKSDETGIVAVGKGVDGLAYVLKDLSGKLKPREWASRAVNYFEEKNADKIVAEVNNGGDLVGEMVQIISPAAFDSGFKKVTASKGKITRAEPIAALYEQGRVKHVGNFGTLEDQMCDYEPENYSTSPDRMDALVWALHELMLEEESGLGIRFL